MAMSFYVLLRSEFSLKKSSYTAFCIIFSFISFTNQIYQQLYYCKKLYFLTWSILLYSSAVNRILTNICLLWEYCPDKHLFLHYTPLHHIAIQYTLLQCTTLEKKTFPCTRLHQTVLQQQYDWQYEYKGLLDSVYADLFSKSEF